MSKSGFNATCRVAGADWTLTFTDEAQRLIGTYAQRIRDSKESVGQLYCRDLTHSDIVIGHEQYCRGRGHTTAAFISILLSQMKSAHYSSKKDGIALAYGTRIQYHTLNRLQLIRFLQRTTPRLRLRT